MAKVDRRRNNHIYSRLIDFIYLFCHSIDPKNFCLFVFEPINMRLATVLLLLAAVESGISIHGDKPTLASTVVTEKGMDHQPTTAHSNSTIVEKDSRWEATIDTVVTIGYSTISVALSAYSIALAREQLRAVEALHCFTRGLLPRFLTTDPEIDSCRSPKTQSGVAIPGFCNLPNIVITF